LQQPLGDDPGPRGLAVSIIGIACTQNYSIEGPADAGRRSVSSPTTSSSSPASRKNGPNYDGFKGVLEVHGMAAAPLSRKRMYTVTGCR
jgi:cytochrome c-type biogenesis protein CcmF